MSTPTPELCHYTGSDTTARLTENDDGTWYSRCHCGTVTCEAGTYDEALTALTSHRGPAPESDPDGT